MAKQDRVTTGGQLARECWTLLRQNSEWMKIPLLSAVGVTIVTVIFGIISLIVFGLTGARTIDQDQSTAQNVIGIILLFLYYFVTYSIVIYSETALVSTVLMKLRGQKDNPTAADGFAVANQRLGAIFGFAALSATVGVIARMISDSGRNKGLVAMIVMALLSAIIRASWAIMTLMVTPVIAAENLGTFPAIGRSWELFKQTWGEQVVGRFSLGFFGCLLTIAALVPGALIALLGSMVNSPVILIGGVGVGLIGIALIALLTNAASGIFKAVIYQYATQGNTGGILNVDVVRQAFAVKA